MRISFIVPTLNEADGIVHALAPLQVWRALGHEVLVADGGSSDATVALAAPLADLVLPAPCGRAPQMNAGAAMARGEVLVFLHADTRLPERAVPLMREALRHRLWGRFDVAIEGRHALLSLVAALMNLRSRLTGIATGDQAIFASRSAFFTAGGYPDQPLMEDIELSKRLKRLGPPACPSERVVTSGRRWEKHGLWRTILLMWRLRFDYWRGVPAERLASHYNAHTACRKTAT